MCVCVCELKKKEIDKKKPGEDGSTVTLILSGSTSLGMSLPIRLHCIFLRTLLALPLLLAMLAAEVPLNGSDVAEPPRWGVVHARRLRTDVYALPRLLRARHLLLLMTMLLLLLLFISIITLLLRLQSPL